MESSRDAHSPVSFVVAAFNLRTTIIHLAVSLLSEIMFAAVSGNIATSTNGMTYHKPDGDAQHTESVQDSNMKKNRDEKAKYQKDLKEKGQGKGKETKQGPSN